MAYPSLFFSILAIPLLFYFLREYFSRNISLALTALMSISYFAVINSRFSSNPNLTPFFVLLFLYAFLKILNSQKINEWRWFLTTGVALGIGIQLHATLFIILPIVTLVIFAYLIKQRRKAVLKGFLVVLFVSLLLNITQIASEIQTRGANSKAFFASIGTKVGAGSSASLIKKIANVSSCQIKANSQIVASLPVIDECTNGFDLEGGAKKLFGEIKNEQSRNAAFLASTLFAIAFSLVGYFLLIYYFKKEKERSAKNFLGLFLSFNIISLIFIVPVITYISIGYFIILFLVPFVLFGLILKFILEKIPKFGTGIATLFFIAVFIFSVLADKSFFEFYSKGLDNDSDNSNLKQTELMAEYMLEKSSQDGSSEIFLDGQDVYIKRFSDPLSYLLRNSGKELVKPYTLPEKGSINNAQEFFFIQKIGSKLVNTIREIQGHAVLGGKRFGRVDLFVLEK
jgi:4-amino-4-deoxy-L-arabinose transferase-like glycosyltransferase